MSDLNQIQTALERLFNEEAQRIVPATLKAQEEIVPDAARLAAGALATGKRRLRLMEVHPLGHDGVVAALDASNEAGGERHAARASNVCRVARAAQEDLHLARPVFLLDLDQGLQLA